ncbi:hypothetical protein GCM10025861_09530 [Methanobacterium petrolearium]|nr:hypothetical protein GCM10025861_09530 [Methanobacterium petrolearium]
MIVSYLHIALNSISIPIFILILINAAIAAYIISGGLAGHKGIRELLSKLYIWKVDLKWYVIALLLYPAINFISLLIGSMVTGISFNEIWPQLSLDALFWFIISCGFIGLVRGPLREEIGWRGFALPRLQYLYSPLVGTLILALIWTFWHLPLHINGIYPGGIEGFYSRCTWNIGITFLFTWIYNHSRGSLLLTTIFHTSINTTGTLLIIPSNISGIWGLAFIAFINIAAILVIVGDKMWQKLPEKSEAVYNY